MVVVMILIIRIIVIMVIVLMETVHLWFGEKVGNLYQPRGGGSFAIPTVVQHFPKTSSTLL